MGNGDCLLVILNRRCIISLLVVCKSDVVVAICPSLPIACGFVQFRRRQKIGNGQILITAGEMSLAFIVERQCPGSTNLANSYHSIGEAYGKQGDYAAAIEIYQKAIPIDERHCQGSTSFGNKLPQHRNDIRTAGKGIIQRQLKITKRQSSFTSVSAQDQLNMSMHVLCSSLGDVYFLLGDN